MRTVIERADNDQFSRTFAIWFDDSNAYFGSDAIAAKIGTDNTPSIVASDEDYTDDAWHHIAVTVESDDEDEDDEGTFALYVDGKKNHEESITGTPDTGAATTRVGKSAASGYDADRYLDGDVDELRIYDRALTAAEVESLYRIDNP